MAIRFRYENLQRQRNKGGGRNDARHAFVVDAGGKHGGKIIPRPAREVVGRGERVVVGEGAENPMMVRMINKRRPAAGMVRVRLTRKNEATRSINVGARRDINPSAALIRSAACVVVKAIWLRSAPTLSLL